MKGSWASWACLASFLGGLGAFFEPPRSRPRAFLCGLGEVWGACWAAPGWSGVVLGIYWADLARSWRLLGGLGWSCAPARRLWGVPGRLWGVSGRLLGGSSAILGRSEPRSALDSPGQPRTAQDKPGQTRTTQDSPGRPSNFLQLRAAQGRPGLPKTDQDS